MAETAAIILAETTDSILPTADFTLCTLRVTLPIAADQMEAVLTPEHRAGMREDVAREGLQRASLVYELDGRRRVIDLETGVARWAGEGEGIRPERLCGPTARSTRGTDDAAAANREPRVSGPPLFRTTPAASPPHLPPPARACPAPPLTFSAGTHAAIPFAAAYPPPHLAPLPMPDPNVIADCTGVRWRIEETRPTSHGWLLFLSRPLQPNGGAARQGKTVVLTRELCDHLAATIDRPYDVDLPLCRPAIARLRRIVGLQWREHRQRWWEERDGDLHAMTENAFVAKHGRSQSAVSWVLKKRRELRRPRRWQHAKNHPPTLRLLASCRNHSETARQLGVAASTVRRWRQILLAGEVASGPQHRSAMRS